MKQKVPMAVALQIYVSRSSGGVANQIVNR